MPASVVFSLHGPPDVTLSGHAALGCFLDLVRRRDPALSAALHANTRLKPFTLSFLVPVSAEPANGPQSRFSFRVTALDDRLAAVVTQSAADRVCVGRVTLDVVRRSATRRCIPGREAPRMQRFWRMHRPSRRLAARYWCSMPRRRLRRTYGT